MSLRFQASCIMFIVKTITYSTELLKKMYISPIYIYTFYFSILWTTLVYTNTIYRYEHV